MASPVSVPQDFLVYKFWHDWWPKEGQEVGPPLYQQEVVIRDTTARYDDEVISPTCNVMKGGEGGDLLPQQPILYREEYGVIEQDLDTKYEEIGTGLAVVCGHPGIGKSVFLYTLLASRLRRGLTTVLEVRGKVHVFNRDGVYCIPNSSDNPKIRVLIPKFTWVLVDADPRFVSSCDTLTDPSMCLFFVLASSPREQHWNDWTSKPAPVTMHFMKPWSWEEVVHGRSMQASRIPEGGELPSEQQLREFYVNFGPSARDIYSYSRNLGRYRKKVETQISKLDFGALTQILAETRDLNVSEASHEIFLIEPDEGQDRDSFQVSIVTPHVMSLLVRNGKLKEIGQLLQFNNHLLSDNATRAAAGMVFKAMFHHLAENGGGPFSMRRMIPKIAERNTFYSVVIPDSTVSRISFPPRQSRIFDLEGLLSDNGSFMVENEYYIPKPSNHPAFDAVTIESDDSGKILTFYRLTVRRDEHHLLPSTLEKVGLLLGTWDPIPKWRIVLVVPSGQVTRAKVQAQGSRLGFDIYLLHLTPREITGMV